MEVRVGGSGGGRGEAAAVIKWETAPASCPAAPPPAPPPPIFSPLRQPPPSPHSLALPNQQAARAAQRGQHGGALIVVAHQALVVGKLMRQAQGGAGVHVGGRVEQELMHDAAQRLVVRDRGVGIVVQPLRPTGGGVEQAKVAVGEGGQQGGEAR